MEVDSGRALTDTADMLVGAYLEYGTVVKHWSRNTTYNYASVLGMLADRHPNLGSVTDDDVRSFLRRERQGRALGNTGAPASQARNLTVIRGFYRWLLREGHVGADPTVDVSAPKVRNRAPRAIPDDDWLALWRAVEGDDVATVATGLGFFCGLRRAELCDLEASHVADPLRIAGFVRKGGGTDSFPYSEVMRVWADLAPHLLGDGGAARLRHAIDRLADDGGRLLWFSDRGRRRPMAPMNLSTRFRWWCRDAGIACTPHALRHSFVTNLLRVGMPVEMVSDLANHSNIGVTMRYVKNSGGRINEWRRSQVKIVAATDHQRSLAERFQLNTDE